VVGPNGCGKSNVIDAVRWVLGESSAKNLRGECHDRCHFQWLNCAQSRFTIALLNWFLIIRQEELLENMQINNELSVKRVVTKEAVSSYLLNGTKCRKRDITDLFLGTWPRAAVAMPS